MSDAEKIEPLPIEPVRVAIIGGTGSGSTGTGDGAPIPSGTVLKTPDHQPNVVVQVVTPIVAVAVRAGNTFCVSVVATLTAGGLTGSVLPHADMAGLLRSAVILAASIAGVGALKDIATIFSGLEKRFPLASGSV
jgi:hypothetical protein